MRFFEATSNQGLKDYWSTVNNSQELWDYLAARYADNLALALKDPHKTLHEFIIELGYARMMMAALTSQEQTILKYGALRDDILVSPIQFNAPYCSANYEEVIRICNYIFREKAKKVAFHEYSLSQQQKIRQITELYVSRGAYSAINLENSEVELRRILRDSTQLLQITFPEPISTDKEQHELDKTVLRVIIHTNPKKIEKLLDEANRYLTKLTNNAQSLSEDEKMTNIAKFFYYYSHATPYKRGSAAVGQLFYRALFKMFNFKLGTEKKENLPLDVQALLCDKAEHFVEMFKHGFIDASDAANKADENIGGDYFFKMLQKRPRILDGYLQIGDNSTPSLPPAILKNVRENINSAVAGYLEAVVSENDLEAAIHRGRANGYLNMFQITLDELLEGHVKADPLKPS